jgi:HEPN domain-containing protein
MEQKELIAYWMKSSDRDFETMQHLFEKKDYHWALFLGHLVLEKLLKAYYVKQIDTNPPLIHNLLRLAEKSGLTVCEEQEDVLDTISTFNIRARYDDYKSEFYQLCTQEFTMQWITHIKELRTWIKHELSKS